MGSTVSRLVPLLALAAPVAIATLNPAVERLSADSGGGVPPRFGGFEARVFGLAPEAGYFFAMHGAQAYLSLRGYREFGARNRNRSEGWNAYLTCALPIGGK